MIPATTEPPSDNSGKAEIPVRWSEIPPPGETCPFTGFNHSYFYSKLLFGPFAEGFVHLTLKEEHETKGKRLYFVPSLNRLLMERAQGAAKVSPSGELESQLLATRFDQARNTPLPLHWFPIPPNGKRSQFVDLSHGGFYRLLKLSKDLIRHGNLCSFTESRSKTFIHAPSLHNFLVNLAEEQSKKKQKRAA